MLISLNLRVTACDRVIHVLLILCGAMESSYDICTTKLDIMLRRILVQRLAIETQQVSTSGNSALDNVSLGKLVINISTRCQKSVTDCAVMHSSRHKKLASIICVKLSTEDHVVLTH